jgi:hypothetical protein
VAPELDPCRGVGDRGVCEGTNRLHCVASKLKTDSCAACQATCAVSVQDGKAICNAQDG